MSMHKIPLTPAETDGLHAHGLQRNIGKPSQLADVFRQGVAWGMAVERKRCAAKVQANADACEPGLTQDVLSSNAAAFGDGEPDCRDCGDYNGICPHYGHVCGA